MEDIIKALSVPFYPMQDHSAGTREERIASFNRRVDELEHSKGVPTTNNFVKKTPKGYPHPSKNKIQSLRPIRIADLQVGTTHRGRIVYCKVVTRVMVMASAMVLVEDDSGLTDLAVYNLDSPKRLLAEGRRIAIIEPFYKLRNDGSPGIRVDDTADLVYDIEDPPPRTDVSAEIPETEVDLPLNAEARLQQLLVSDSTCGVDKLYKKLVDEGYNLNKKQIRALKASFRKQEGSDANHEAPLVPVISERRPEKHRILVAYDILKAKKAGNTAFESENFREAEEHYTMALENQANNERGSEDDLAAGEAVALWQLYANRAAARMRLGKLDEALDDSRASNICAPRDEVKPILRCAESLMALGLVKETNDLLHAASLRFPCNSDIFNEKQTKLSPKQVLRVGKAHEFKTISSALKEAPAGAEVLVDPGVYKESVVIQKSVTIRCTSVCDGFAAVKALEGSSDHQWAEIQSSSGSPVYCLAKALEQIRIIGFRLVSLAPLAASVPAVLVGSGVVVARDCWVKSASGPCVTLENDDSRLIMQACAVCEGAQGGVLVADNAKLSMQQTHCCGNEASGLEVREGGSALVERCHFYSNKKQGIVVWKSAGNLTLKNCDIHSHCRESGVLVGEAEATIESCRLYGNYPAGVACEKKGVLYLRKCEIYNNADGAMIQDTGSARVEKCNIYSNNENGIFIGQDHLGLAEITENSIYRNRCEGIFVGAKGRLDIRDNNVFENQGSPQTLCQDPRILRKYSGSTKRKHIRRLEKNERKIQQAFEERIRHSNSGVFMKEGMLNNYGQTFVKIKQAQLYHCARCGRPPPSQRAWSECSVCRGVSYCSKECQRADWRKHKIICAPERAKYPSFLDNQESV